MKNKFNKNDIVQIINEGDLYPNYDTGAKYLGLENWNRHRDRGVKGQSAKIVNFIYHPNNNETIIYGIRLLKSNDEIIIHADGLKLISSYNIFPDDLLFTL